MHFRVHLFCLPLKKTVEICPISKETTEEKGVVGGKWEVKKKRYSKDWWDSSGFEGQYAKSNDLSLIPGTKQEIWKGPFVVGCVKGGGE